MQALLLDLHTAERQMLTLLGRESRMEIMSCHSFSACRDAVQWAVSTSAPSCLRNTLSVFSDLVVPSMKPLLLPFLCRCTASENKALAASPNLLAYHLQEVLGFTVNKLENLLLLLPLWPEKPLRFKVDSK